MTRRKPEPADDRVRDGLINDAVRLQVAMDRVGAGVFSRLTELRAGQAVTVAWWELPDFVKSSMPRPASIQESWTVTADNVLVVGETYVVVVAARCEN